MEFLAPVAVLGTIFFGLHALVRSVQKARLRKMMLEKNTDPEMIKVLLRERKSDPFPNLRFGLVLIALGGALFVGEIINNPAITAALMLIFAGIALLGYFFITRDADTRRRVFPNIKED